MSVLGLVVHLGLAGVAAVLLLKGARASSGVFACGYALSVLGLMSGLYFTYITAFVIKVPCVWCSASAVVLGTTATCYALAARRERPEPVAKPDAIVAFVGGVALLLFGGVLENSYFLQAGAAPRLDFTALERLPTSEIAPSAGHWLGSASAPRTLVMFLDADCPHCAEAYQEARGLLRRRGDLRVVLRHRFLDPDSRTYEAGLALEAAGLKGRFWEFADLVFRKGHGEDYRNLLAKVGLTPKEAEEGRRDPRATERVRADRELARRVRFRGAPLIILIQGGRRHVLPGSSIEPFLR